MSGDGESLAVEWEWASARNVRTGAAASAVVALEAHAVTSDAAVATSLAAVCNALRGRPAPVPCSALGGAWVSGSAAPDTECGMDGFRRIAAAAIKRLAAAASPEALGAAWPIPVPPGSQLCTGSRAAGPCSTVEPVTLEGGRGSHWVWSTAEDALLCGVLRGSLSAVALVAERTASYFSIVRSLPGNLGASHDHLLRVLRWMRELNVHGVSGADSVVTRALLVELVATEREPDSLLLAAVMHGLFLQPCLIDEALRRIWKAKLSGVAVALLLHLPAATLSQRAAWFGVVCESATSAAQREAAALVGMEIHHRTTGLRRDAKLNMVFAKSAAATAALVTRQNEAAAVGEATLGPTEANLVRVAAELWDVGMAADLPVHEDAAPQWRCPVANLASVGETEHGSAIWKLLDGVAVTRCDCEARAESALKSREAELSNLLVSTDDATCRPFRASLYLPDDVLLLVLAYLRPPGLVRCRAVCVQWRDAASQPVLWRRVYARRWRSKVVCCHPPSHEHDWMRLIAQRHSAEAAVARNGRIGRLCRACGCVRRATQSSQSLCKKHTDCLRLGDSRSPVGTKPRAVRRDYDGDDARRPAKRGRLALHRNATPTPG